MNIIGSCNSCLLEVNSNDKYINCPDCKRLYHQECWKKNNYKCSEFGCKGSKEIIEGNSNNLIQNEPVESQPENNIEDNISQNNINNDISENLNTNNPNDVVRLKRVSNKSPKDSIILALVCVIAVLLGFIIVNYSITKAVKNTQLKTNPTPTPVIEQSIQPTETPEVIITPSSDLYEESASPEATPTSEVSETPSSESENAENNNFNLDMNLTEYYTIQVATETDKDKAEKVVGIIPDSFIMAKPRPERDKTFYYVVLLGKFANEEDAHSYRKYILEHPSVVSDYKGFYTSFITNSSSLQDISVINDNVEVKPEETPSTENTEIIQPSPTNLISNNSYYYTVQVSSRDGYYEAKSVADNIPGSVIMKKYSRGRNYYVVVVGKLETKEEAERYREYIIKNYSGAGSSEDVPKSWVITSNGLTSISGSIN